MITTALSRYLSIDLDQRDAVALPIQPAHVVRIAAPRRRWWRAETEPGLDHVAGHQLAVGLKGTERAEVLDRQAGFRPSEDTRVVGGQLEADPRSRVGQDRRAHRWVQLGE